MKKILVILITAIVSTNIIADDFPKISVKDDAPFPTLNTKQENIKEQKITWFNNYENAVEEINRTNKPIFILFTDPISCIPCRELEVGALKEKEVIVKLNNYVCLKVNTNEGYGLNLATRFNVRGWPTMIIYKSGNWVKTHLGKLSKEEMIEFLDIEKGKK